MFRLSLRGIERHLQHVPIRAKPISPSILHSLAAVAASGGFLDRTCFCAALLLFFLMARAGNVFCDPLNSDIGLRGRDISFFEDHILVTFRRTKTIQFGRRRLVLPVFASHSALCVVSACRKMCSSHVGCRSSPFFVRDSLSDAPLTKRSFLVHIRDMLSRAGVSDPFSFSCHSFRRGGASWAFSVGLPGEFIQISGDWASDCYKSYLEVSMETKVHFAKHIANSL